MNPAAEHARELAREVIHMSESPSQSIMIYIPELWNVRKGTACDCGQTISKTGDSMHGNLDMGGNKITGLYNDYPPRDMDNGVAATWHQVLRVLESYVSKQGSSMTGPLGFGRNILISEDNITIRHRPTADTDAVNKKYVDSITHRKPIITVFATSRDEIRANKYEWHFGERSRENKPHGYRILTDGKIISGIVDITFVTDQDYDNAEVVKIIINDEETSINIGTSILGFTLNLQAGDKISFKSLVTIPHVLSATVSLLIELDLP